MTEETEKLTIKEMQTFRLLHELRRALRSGQVEITWHEHDFTNVMVSNGNVGSQTEGLDKFKILLNTVFGSSSNTA